MRLSYVVTAELESEEVRDRYLAWLGTGGHARDVCAAGASSCEVVLLDGAAIRVETRYVFASREAFERYEREEAPRLRAEGRALFPSGVEFTRHTGIVVHVEGALR